MLTIAAPEKRCFRSRWERLLGECESPIESDLLATMCEVAREHGYDVAPKDRGDNETIVIKPQAWMDRYRVDFLIRFPFFGSELLMVVEADGHDWHERTKGQARRDRSRDRAMQALGYVVLRFTGSEIRQDARLCGREVLGAIMDWQSDTLAQMCPTPWGHS